MDSPLDSGQKIPYHYGLDWNPKNPGMEGSTHSNPLYNTASKWMPYICLNASSDGRLTTSEEALPLLSLFHSGHDNAFL